MDAIFSSPASLWAALLAVPLLLLFMLRHRPVKRRVASTLLWRGAAQMQVATSPFQRLRRSLSLILLLLALAALVLALAGLRIPGARARGAPITLVIDITAGMQAREGESTRLQLAQTRAIALLQAAGDAPITVLAWDGVLRPATPARADLARARAAIQRLTAADYGSTDAALHRALRTLAEQSAGQRIVLVSSHAPGTLGPETVFVPAATPRPNTGIVAAALTEVSADRQELFFGLEHFGPEPARATLTIERHTSATETELLDARDVTLVPGVRAAITLEIRQPGLYRGRLRGGDALELDDIAWVRYSRLPAQDVALHGPVPAPLVRALEAMQAAAGSVRIIDPLQAGPMAMHVFAGMPPLEPPGMPAVYLLPGGAPASIRVGEIASAGDGLARPSRHSLWRGAGVPDIRAGKVWPFTTQLVTEPLLDTSAGPALAVARRDGNSRIEDLLVAMSLDDEGGGFASRVAFVIFWENWFDAGRRLHDPLPRGATSTADVVEIAPLAGRGPFKYTPAALNATLESVPGQPLQMDTVGLYTFSGLSAPEPAYVGASLLDAAASNLMLAPGDVFEPQAAVDALAAIDRQGEPGDLPLYPWLAMLAAALVFAEWVLFRRRFPAIAEAASSRAPAAGPSSRPGRV